MILHDYFRSGSAFRVRIVLNLKGLDYAQVAHHLRRAEHRAPDYLALNPQGLIPALEVDGDVLTQSLAICEYLEEIHPDPPILPADPIERAHVRAFAYAIACDIHPVQNLKVLERLRAMGHDQEQINAWARQTIEEGLDACAKLIERQPGPFCFGKSPTLADVCLVSILANARRFGAQLRWPRLLEAEAAAMALPAFQAAAPERQPDAE
jgi:maleylpyruvate isomerase